MVRGKSGLLENYSEDGGLMPLSRSRKQKRDKSGLKAPLFSALSPEDKAEVRVLMQIWNANTLNEPYFEVDEFYHAEIRGVNV
jgi:hypothetical protein